jgi:hypothetical protein
MTNPIPRRVFLAVFGGVALAVTMAGCGGGHKSAKNTGTVSAGGRTMRFQLADASTGPVSAAVPSQPIATSPTNLAGATLKLYVVKRLGANAVLVVFGITASGQNDVAETDLDSNLDSLVEKSGFNQAAKVTPPR